MRTTTALGLCGLGCAGALFALGCGSSSSGNDTPAPTGSAGTSGASVGGSSAGGAPTGGTSGAANGGGGSGGSTNAGSGGVSASAGNGGDGATGGTTSNGGQSSSGGAGGSSAGHAGTSASGASGAGGSKAGAGGASGAAGAGGMTIPIGPTGGVWTVIALLDDAKSDPSGSIAHSDDDVVQSISFDTSDHGVVGTQFGGTGDEGGALFEIAGGKTKALAQAGFQASTDGTMTSVSFDHLFTTPSGLVATTDDAITFGISADKGATWSLVNAGGGLQDTTATPSVFQYDGTNAWLALSDGFVYQAQKALPGEGTQWFALSGVCGDGPTGGDEALGAGHSRNYFYVSPDGKTAVYPFHSKSSVCVSSDGGGSFHEAMLMGAPSAATSPRGVAFSTAKVGCTWASDSTKDGAEYVFCTVDGGATWTQGSLPDSITAAGSKANLRNMFFAPDGKTGWMIGNVGDDAMGGPPLLLKTYDGGQNWFDISLTSFTGGSIVTPAAAPVLQAGFAFDDHYIWIGGSQGLLMAHTTGGT